jgi:hypothetical protein
MAEAEHNKNIVVKPRTRPPLRPPADRRNLAA